ncbi:MAG: NADH-quinone oxidoreductase subunit N [Caldimicrobium sp.]
MYIIKSFLPEFYLSLSSLFLFLFNSLFLKKHTHQFFLWLINLIIGALIFWISSSYTNYQINFFYNDILHLNFRLIIFLFGIILYFSLKDTLANITKINEFSVLFSFTVLFSSLISATSNLLIAFLLIETLSLTLYVLVSFYKRNSLSLEAGIKYYLLGTLSSLFFFLGLFFIYYVSFEFSLFKIFEKLDQKNYFLYFGFILIFIGVTFKLGGVPFHFWLPEVYQGSPLIVFPQLIVISKISFVLFLANLIYPFIHYETKNYLNLNIFQNFFFIISLLSMAIGNFLAIKQKEVKRLLAYSSIAHIGYLYSLLAIPWYSNIITIFLGYIFIYSLTLIGLLLILLQILDKELIKIKLSSLESLLKDKNFIFLISFLIYTISLAGLPPTAGFLVKLLVLLELIKNAYYFLALIFLLTSVLSIYYYFKLAHPVLKLLKQRAYELKFKKMNFFEITLTTIILLISLYILFSTFNPKYIFFFE